MKHKNTKKWLKSFIICKISPATYDLLRHIRHFRHVAYVNK